MRPNAVEVLLLIGTPVGIMFMLKLAKLYYYACSIIFSLLSCDVGCTLSLK